VYFVCFASSENYSY